MAEYFYENNIDAVIEEALFFLGESKPDKPLQYLASYFASKLPENDFKAEFKCDKPDSKIVTQPKFKVQTGLDFKNSLSGLASSFGNWGISAEESTTKFHHNIHDITKSQFESHDIAEIGIVVTDDECITKFSNIYQDICQKYFKSNSFQFKSAFDNLRKINFNNSTLIQSVSIEVKRNFKEFCFPAMITIRQMKEIYTRIPPVLESEIFNLNNPRAAELLRKYDTDFKLPKCDRFKLNLMTECCGVLEFENVLVKINTSNHLEMVCKAETPQEAYFIYSNAYRIISSLIGKEFSLHQKYGFCTSSIKDLGTGLIITAKLSPSRSINKITGDTNFSVSNCSSILLQIRSTPCRNEQEQFKSFIDCLNKYHS